MWNEAPFLAYNNWEIMMTLKNYLLRQGSVSLGKKKVAVVSPERALRALCNYFAKYQTLQGAHRLEKVRVCRCKCVPGVTTIPLKNLTRKKRLDRNI